jgi:hypothetical protein
MGKKKESAFMRDINTIIKEENVVTTISEEDAHINYCGDELDEGVFKKGDYLYTFNGFETVLRSFINIHKHL